MNRFHVRFKFSLCLKPCIRSTNLARAMCPSIVFIPCLFSFELLATLFALVDRMLAPLMCIEAGLSGECHSTLVAFIVVGFLLMLLKLFLAIKRLAALDASENRMIFILMLLEAGLSGECLVALLTRIDDYLFRLNTAACIDLSPAIATAFIQHDCRHYHADYTDTGNKCHAPRHTA